eukprot:15241491-Alexandrium_andersonii.AAC.1
MPLLSTGSADLRSALEYHPTLAAARQFEDALRSLATLAVDLKECDGATSNDRYVAHVLDTSAQREGGRVLVACLTCGNHGNQLIQGATVATVGRHAALNCNLLNDYYCMTLFMRSGGHFVRL